MKHYKRGGAPRQRPAPLEKRVLASKQRKEETDTEENEIHYLEKLAAIQEQLLMLEKEIRTKYDEKRMEEIAGVKTRYRRIFEDLKSKSLPRAQH